MSLDWWLDLDYELNTGKEVRQATMRVWEGNLTYNLSNMLNVAFGLVDELEGYSVAEQVLFKKGVSYVELWEGKTGGDCIEGLQYAIDRMEASPDKYKRYNPSNGWGTYEGALKALKEFLVACEEYPRAKVEMWR